MAKGGKMFDAIMIVIIMITIMNYADYIKVDTKLMMVLLSIALYVTAKNMQKSKNQNTNKKVEPLEGSTVAFDKEAFVILNKIVNELVKQDSVTIPGNLIVKGALTVMNPSHDENDKANFRIKVSDDGIARVGNQHGGEINFDQDGWLRCSNWEKPGELKKGIAAEQLWCGTYIDTRGGKLEFDATHGINIQHGEQYIRIKSGVGSEVNIARMHHIVGVGWGAHDGKWHHAASGKVCLLHNPSHQLGFMKDNDQYNFYINGSGIGTYQHVEVPKGNLTVAGTTTLKGALICSGAITGPSIQTTGNIYTTGGNVYGKSFRCSDNHNQGLLFNQGDRQIRLATGTADAMLDFDKASNSWMMSYKAGHYYEFNDTNINWIAQRHNGGVRWSF
jgi:hypothetical protein